MAKERPFVALTLHATVEKSRPGEAKLGQRQIYQLG